jgi:predicted ribosome quality control (RQC) complex YloA/Tae2 family protein
MSISSLTTDFQPVPPKLYRYELADGWEVLAGKTDEDNDRLSLGMAKADDWWFHVRGMPGSHVVLFHPEQNIPPREILRQAASIAAYHSKARNGGLTAVSYTQARYVTKPKGAKPGTVHIRRETVIRVRPGLPVS